MVTSVRNSNSDAWLRNLVNSMTKKITFLFSMRCSFKSLLDFTLSLKSEGTSNGAWRNLLRSSGADLGNIDEHVENSFQRRLQAISLIAFSSVVGRHGGTCLAGGLDASHAELCCHLLDAARIGTLLEGACVFIGHRSKTTARFEMDYPSSKLLWVSCFSC